MSPAKKPPRPVTAWFHTYVSKRGFGEIVVRDRVRAGRERMVRCRVTPLRPATDAEIQKLATRLEKSISEASGLPYLQPAHWRVIARAAFKKGARP